MFFCFIFKHAGELEKNVTNYDAEVAATLQSCSEQINENRQKVIEMLLAGVERCEPRIHPNAELKLRMKRKGMALGNEQLKSTSN